MMTPETLRKQRAELLEFVRAKRVDAEQQIKHILLKLAAETDTAIESVEVSSVRINRFESAAPIRILDHVTIKLEYPA